MTATSVGGRTSATGARRIDALDGMRAFALCIIMGFHFGVSWLQGGFFSLDIFYVLSGYLITGLLLGEYARHARIDLPAFWLRRARRLLPALVVVVVVVSLLVRFASTAGLYPQYRMDALSALFYFSNWWQIAVSGNYFVATGAVQPLTHTWSLSVEEQFYLVWPLVVLAVLRLSGSVARGVRAVLAVAVAGTVGSAVEMAVLSARGAGVTRLYFGTDTHAQSILLGAVLACVLTQVQRRRGLEGMAPTAGSRRARVALTALGLAGLAGTAVLTATARGTDTFDYRGGFLLSALSAAALITGAVTVEGGPIARVLALRPVVWLGTVSYGAYLWHFPVQLWLDGSRTGLTGPALLALRSEVTVVLAGLSYVLVERPVMEGRFWRTARAALPAVAALGTTVVVVVAATVGPAAASATPVPAAPLTGAEHRALAAAGAFTGRPIRFLLVGDSLAYTLSEGLRVDSVPDDGVEVINRAVLGCDIDDLHAVVTGQLASPVSACRTWPALWGGEVDRLHPEVVGVLLGRWQITDHLVDGRYVSIDQPGWRAHLQREMEHVVAVLSSRGARVLLLTMPYIDPPQEQPDGSPWPEDRPGRVDEWNALLRRVAATDPRVVSVLDLNALVGPSHRYQRVVDGVTVRWADGEHFSVPGGEWLRSRLLPTVARLGLEVRRGTTTG